MIDRIQPNQTFSAKEFYELLKKDPSWAKTVTVATYIEDFVDLDHNNITTLSPLLHFLGRNQDGKAASFEHCHQLRNATGNFHGLVSFAHSYITSTDGIQVLAPDNRGIALDCHDCSWLETAGGQFQGSIHCTGCENLKIVKETLKVYSPNIYGIAANFERCKKMETFAGTYVGAVRLQDCGQITLGKYDIQAPDKDPVKSYYEEPILKKLLNITSTKILNLEALDKLENKTILAGPELLIWQKRRQTTELLAKSGGTIEI